MTDTLAAGPASELAPAKINLALHVRARQADGYHGIETLFAFTQFGDVLHASPADHWSLALTGPMAADTGPIADNLVLRAAHRFAEASGWAQRLAFRLDKRIPVAAGLGGGSADAAAALRLLNRLAGHPLADSSLAGIAAGLGADVPACLAATTCIGHGRGEQLVPGPDLAGLPVLLVNPRVPVPTGPVFAGWDGIDRGPLGADWRAGRNDLTDSAIAIQPLIGTVLQWLHTLPGVSLVRMSGSGATCLALFQDQVPAISPAHDWWAVATVLR